MKVKELLKTVNVAWSPQAQHPILLAAGTAAQQLDASFSTSASLDIYELGLRQPGREMELKASIPSEHRFHKIIWGSYGQNAAGMIVGGCDYGIIKIYSAAKLLANDSNCLISSPDRHTGPVRAMDFNPFQTNLLATGATESEIYIWDVVNTSTPMTPGSKSQPLEDVQHIAWNKQVQHILASTFPQRCVIWDLRKNEPIIKLTDANSRVRWKVVQWHPEVATQLCLASEDDQSPVIELWDLRFATSPLKTLQSHQRGVLSIAWNPHDPDLLLSCGKDNRILCWNPNSDAPNGEVICELAQTNQWNFDVSWCPRHPGLIVGTSFDGHAVVYSLLGGQQQTSVETSQKIVDSFPGMDPFSQAPPAVHQEPTVLLKKAPKWLKRPFGASFGFGGKLTIFENEPADPNLPANSNRKVFISQVITDPDLIQRSNELETALKNEQYNDYCKGKADNATDEHDRRVWNCVGAYFSGNVTRELLELLGYDPEAMTNKLNQYVPQQDVDTITDGLAKLDSVPNGNILDGSAAFDAIAQQEHNRKSPAPAKLTEHSFKINTSDDEDGLITQAILLGNIEAAVSLCFSSKRYADAVILSMTGGPELLARTQYRYFSEHSGALNSLINSLVSEDWADIVKNCDINCWKEALVGVFTHSNAEERSALCDMLGDRLASSDNPNLKRQAQICYICSGNLNKTIEASKGSIQENVELVTIMQKALELQGIREIRIEGNIATTLSQYAEMLAAEGNLEAALNYLENSQEEKIVALKDRLCRALGYIQEEPQRVLPRGSITQNYYDQSRKPQQALPNPYNPLPTTPASNWNTAPTKQPYNPMNQYNSPKPEPYGMKPVQPLQPAYSDQYPSSNYGQIPAAQPALPPPTAASGSSLSGSRPSSVGPQSRSKYILDPSVKSSPAYGVQSTFSQQSHLYNSQQVSPVPGFPVQASYQSPMSASSSYPGQPQNTMFSPAASELTKPVQPNIMTSMTNSTQNQMYNPVMSQPLAQTQSQQQNYGNDDVYQPTSQPSGWNDPPVGKCSRAQPVLALCNKNEMSAEHAGSRKWKEKHSKNISIKVVDFHYSECHPIMC
ncbi:protein transport protein Sec31A isoform X2 [Cephus cinctus]|uniref:Protein transport protein Sec31A isoform X2 n=1 Tax=Cephus cinctus TaxID=211228 RepID=A0AAJ7CDA1_CEPCN|nr:protein transport protein Sec31A isoform X2 [Cephus cinctus]